MEAYPFSFEKLDALEPPIPDRVARPLEMVLTHLQANRVVFIVQAKAKEDALWLNAQRLERPLHLGPLESLHLEAWPILGNAWVVSLKLPSAAEDGGAACRAVGFEEPLADLQVQLALQAILQRLQTEWYQEHGADRPMPFSILPIASLTVGAMQQDHIAELNTLLEVMVQGQLGVHFHPIVQLREARVVGYEALIRMPSRPSVQHTGALLKAVERGSLLAWFDLACLERCFQEAGKQGLQQLLFVNLDAEGIMALSTQDRPLLQRVYDSGLSPRQIVIEVTERQAVKDFPGLLREIQRLRDDGFRIAIDDAGSGYNSLEIIAELLPDFIKLDRSLVRNLNRRGENRCLVEAIVRFTGQIGVKTLGEGVETPSELSLLIDLGVQYAQGYLFGRPQEAFHGLPRAVRERIHHQIRQQERLQVGRALCVGDLKQAGLTMAVGTPLLEAARRFTRNDGLTSIVVTNSGEVCGVLMRQTLDMQLELARQARASAFLTNETVERWMESKFVSVPEHLTLDEAINYLTYRSSVSLETDLIVTDAAGAYRGILPVRLLLEAALKRCRNSACHTSGLTGLPDRLALEQALQERLEAKQSTGLIRVDILGLNDYNRANNSALGDVLIMRVAEHIQRVSKELGAPTDQVFHLGGDNFVLLTQAAKVSTLCYALAEPDGMASLEGAPSFKELEKRLHVVGLTFRTLDSLKRAQGRPLPTHARAALQALENLLRGLRQHPNLFWAVDSLPARLPKSA